MGLMLHLHNPLLYHCRYALDAWLAMRRKRKPRAGARGSKVRKRCRDQSGSFA
jgi:hypothetical protein